MPRMIDDLSNYLLRRARERGLSQTELANRAGISREMVSRIINGKVTEPSQSTLAALAFALDEHPRALSRRLMEGMPFAASSAADRADDDSGFVRDVTYPDYTPVSTGQQFTKIWRVQNLGSVAWQQRWLQCCDDSDPYYRRVVQADGRIEFVPVTFLLKPHAMRIAVPETAAGDAVELAVAFTAPETPCTCISRWRMVDAEGQLCFPEYSGISCLVQVVSSG